jgi:hypothetical protein
LAPDGNLRRQAGFAAVKIDIVVAAAVHFGKVQLHKVPPCCAVWKESNKRIINNGCVMPMTSHFNQANHSGKKHSSQSSLPVLFAPRAAHQHDSLFIIIHWQHRTIPA